MNFLVVDDDDVICKGVQRRLVNMKLAEIKEVYLALSAEDALHVVAEKQVDIMITDIRMQQMDGLELIERTAQIQPFIHFIVLTAYDHFQYAQTALRLGVADFLLKPCSEKEMREVVQRVIHQLDKQQHENHMQLSWAVDECIRENGDVSALPQIFARHGMSIPKQLLIIQVLAGEEEELSAAGDAWIYQPKDKHYALCDAQKRKEIIAALKTRESPVGVSDDGDLNQVKELYLQTCLALEDRWYQNEQMVLQYHASQVDAHTVSAVVMEVLTTLKKESNVNARRELFTVLYQHQGDIAFARMLYMRLYQELKELSKLWEISQCPIAYPITFFSNWQNAFEQVFKDFASLQYAATHQRERTPVDFAKRYVREHLNTECDMGVIANQLDLSYTYFSTLFKEQTGQTFSEFAMQMRMEEAARRLRAGERVTAIAKCVGYQNVQNFSRAFTRYFGVQPRLFKESR
ncbi:MAG: response regulator [Acinetobacter sp.]